MANKPFKINNSLEVTGNITTTGTVGGRNLSSDGSKLDGIAPGATAGGGSFSSLTDTTVSTTIPTITTNPSAVGHVWVNSTTGFQYICTDNTTNANVWKNVGLGSADVVPSFLPAGAIIPFNGTTIPSGWSTFSAATNKYLVGAGNTYNAEATGGSDTVTVSSSSAGSHTGTSSGGVSACCSNGRVGSSAAGSHHHGSSNVTFTAAYEQVQLIQCSSNQIAFPVNGVALSATTAGFSNTSNILGNGGLLKAGTSLASSTGTSSFNWSSAVSAGNHSHGSTGGSEQPFGGASQRHSHTVSNGNHSAGSTAIPYTQNYKRKLLSAWSNASSSFSIANNMIVMWIGLNLPEGGTWSECNGTGGTPDLRDYFIELVASGDVDTTGAGGANLGTTFSLDYTHSAAHNHSGSTQARPESTSAYHINNYDWSHTHLLTGTHTPPYYAIKFIQYTG